MVDKKTLRAPFAGRSASAPSISANISAPAHRSSPCRRSIRSIVDFYLPQQALTSVAVGQTGRRQGRRLPGPDLHRQDHRDQSEGRSSEPQRAGPRDASTNPDRKLLPGMYANDRDRDRHQHERIVTLPQTAITYNPYGDTVYIVETRAQRQGATASRSSSRARPSSPRPDARRSGRGPQGRQGRRRRS